MNSSVGMGFLLSPVDSPDGILNVGEGSYKISKEVAFD